MADKGHGERGPSGKPDVRGQHNLGWSEPLLFKMDSWIYYGDLFVVDDKLIEYLKKGAFHRPRGMLNYNANHCDGLNRRLCHVMTIKIPVKPPSFQKYVCVWIIVPTAGPPT